MHQQRTDIYIEEQALWEIWQDFGVVGTPATDSAGSIRVYAAAQKSVAPPRRPLHLGREGREKVLCSLAWGAGDAFTNALAIPVVMLALTFHLYARSSIVSLVLTLQRYSYSWGTSVFSLALML